MLCINKENAKVVKINIWATIQAETWDLLGWALGSSKRETVFR